MRLHLVSNTLVLTLSNLQCGYEVLTRWFWRRPSCSWAGRRCPDSGECKEQKRWPESLASFDCFSPPSQPCNVTRSLTWHLHGFAPTECVMDCMNSSVPDKMENEPLQGVEVGCWKLFQNFVTGLQLLLFLRQFCERQKSYSMSKIYPKDNRKYWSNLWHGGSRCSV